VFDFRFDDPDAALQQLSAAEQALQLRAERGGVFNAVAFWFDLELSPGVQLSSGAAAGRGPTWKQVRIWELLIIKEIGGCS
jgi:hypothetical protein